MRHDDTVSYVYVVRDHLRRCVSFLNDSHQWILAFIQVKYARCDNTAKHTHTEACTQATNGFELSTLPCAIQRILFSKCAEAEKRLRTPRTHPHMHMHMHYLSVRVVVVVAFMPIGVFRRVARAVCVAHLRRHPGKKTHFDQIKCMPTETGGTWVTNSMDFALIPKKHERQRSVECAPGRVCAQTRQCTRV